MICRPVPLAAIFLSLIGKVLLYCKSSRISRLGATSMFFETKNETDSVEEFLSVYILFLCEHMLYFFVLSRTRYIHLKLNLF